MPWQAWVLIVSQVFAVASNIHYVGRTISVTPRTAMFALGSNLLLALVTVSWAAS